VTPVTQQQAQAAANAAVAAAVAAGTTNVNVQMRNVGEVPLAAFNAITTAAAGRPANMIADSVAPGTTAVDVRVTVNPAAATTALNLSASTGNARALTTKAVFDRWFTNDKMVVSLGQQGNFGQVARIAARLPANLNTQNLYFYAFNTTTNTYARIEAPNYRIDANGYVHFSTARAGEIIISNGPLARRG
jgi:hypothetical protein